MSESDLQILKLPFAFARSQRIVVTGFDDENYEVAVTEGATLSGLVELNRLLGTLPFALRTVSDDEFERVLSRVYEGEDASQAMEMMEEGLDLSSVAQQLNEPRDLLESDDDAPIIRLINALLTEAIKENASDIHVEPYESRLSIRFRVDGVLREVLQPPKAIAPLLVSRIKVMAKLDIAEKRLPQDGRISLRVAGRSVDVRVSSIPSGHGERVVLRLLDKQAGRLDIHHLGLVPEAEAQLTRLISKPHGVILVTGPTGSGKSTTLYAILSQLNSRTRNILTVEDPIEYYLEGVGQTQVNQKVDMTFARGLRAILRQDPDVVMIGEIRDLETAEIAVQASLTGHLVLSTLHTNTAVGAATRLRDMGVASFLVASSLIGIVAQRLVRVLCDECKESYRPDQTELALVGIDEVDGDLCLYRANGCAACNYIGYLGRTGIYEVVEVDDTLRTMIHDDAGEHDLETYARTRSQGLFADGQRRLLAGDISVEELLRVTSE